MSSCGNFERSLIECSNKAATELPETGTGRLTLFLFSCLRFCHQKRGAADRGEYRPAARFAWQARGQIKEPPLGRPRLSEELNLFPLARRRLGRRSERQQVRIGRGWHNLRPMRGQGLTSRASGTNGEVHHAHIHVQGVTRATTHHSSVLPAPYGTPMHARMPSIVRA
jgi:hypothetical protein